MTEKEENDRERAERQRKGRTTEKGQNDREGERTIEKGQNDREGAE